MAEKKKMRVSHHNGRWGTERHSGRNFDLSKADHIDPERTKLNVYYTWDGGPMEGCELRYYQKQFGAALDAQNEKYRKKGNHSRVRTMAEFMTARQHRPEECILQIGKMGDDIDPAVFRAAVEDYVKWESDIAGLSGSVVQILDYAIHYDEASPHAHVRRVWQYYDFFDDIWRVGQNRALEGPLSVDRFGLPDPTQPEGPKNNRKMTYDAMCRNAWLDICERYGFQVEREPEAAKRTHLPKEQYQALQDERRALEARERAVQQREKESSEAIRRGRAAMAEDIQPETDTQQQRRLPDISGISL